MSDAGFSFDTATRRTFRGGDDLEEVVVESAEDMRVRMEVMLAARVAARCGLIGIFISEETDKDGVGVSLADGLSGCGSRSSVVMMSMSVLD